MANSSKKTASKEGLIRSESARRLGRRVRHLRAGKGLTQEKFAELCGISPRYISELERGEANVTINILEPVAASLGIKLKDLFDFEHESERGLLMEEIAKLLDAATDEQLETIYRIMNAVAR